MKRLALVALCLVMAAGCRWRDRQSGDYDVARVRAEIRRQYEFLGIEVSLADKVKITVLHCAATGESSDGPYVCAQSDCARIDIGCVHAWEMSAVGSDVVTFMFAGLARDWTIRHEVGHFVQRRWCDNPAELSVKNGHPDAVHIRGRLVKSRDLIGGARWPAGLLDSLLFWTPEVGAAFGDAILDGDGTVLHVEPVPGIQEAGSGI